MNNLTKKSIFKRFTILAVFGLLIISWNNDDNNPKDVNEAGNLSSNTTYSGSIELLNEAETPAEDITEEVTEEKEEHQFFFTVGGSITEVIYTDEDDNGDPVGLSFALTTPVM